MCGTVKVSVIIPAFNVEMYIKECVMSVLQQTLSEIEVIVVDDGSTDSTAVLVSNLIHKDKRIKLIKKINEGVGYARNTALMEAIGEYVLFLDADDTLPLDACEKLYNTAKLKGADIICGKSMWKEGATLKDVSYNPYWFGRNMSDQENYADNIKIITGLPIVTSKLFKRDLIVNNNLQFSHYIGEDTVFWLYSWDVAKTIYLLSDTVYWRRQRKNPNNKSITQVNNSKSIIEKLKTLDICMEYCKEQGYLHIYRQILCALRSILIQIFKLSTKEEKIIAVEEFNNFCDKWRLSNKLLVRLIYTTKNELRWLQNNIIGIYILKIKILGCIKLENCIRRVFRMIKRY